jgi:hypothetical protein
MWMFKTLHLFAKGLRECGGGLCDRSLKSLCSGRFRRSQSNFKDARFVAALDD